MRGEASARDRNRQWASAIENWRGERRRKRKTSAAQLGLPTRSSLLSHTWDKSQTLEWMIFLPPLLFLSDQVFFSISTDPVLGLADTTWLAKLHKGARHFIFSFERRCLENLEISSGRHHDGAWFSFLNFLFKSSFPLFLLLLFKRRAGRCWVLVLHLVSSSSSSYLETPMPTGCIHHWLLL